jgi:hypothetical protein
VTGAPRDFELAFSTEPVAGWRVWRVCRGIDRAATVQQLTARLLAVDDAVGELLSYRLRSLTELEFWPARERMAARCGIAGTDHGAAPGAACECGVWAFKEREAAEDVLAAYRYAGMAMAVGRVALWGRVIEHRDGYRAQFAYPTELTVYGAAGPVADEVRAAYGVPVALAPFPPAAEAA